MESKIFLKKIVSIAIAVLLMVNVLPFNVFADDTDFTSTNNVEESEILVEEDQSDIEEYYEENTVVETDEVDDTLDDDAVDFVQQENLEEDITIVEDTSKDDLPVQDNSDVFVSQDDENKEEEVILEDTVEEEKEEITEEEIDTSKQYEYRLIVGFTSDPEIRENDVVLGEYDDVVLLGFDNSEELNEAKQYYEVIALFASVDGTLSAADNQSSGIDIDSAESSANETASIEENPLTLANDTNTTIVVGNSVIALIDTGASGSNVVKQLSVLGEDVNDNNGHGSALASVIADESPNAKIISIKALNEYGQGTVASVYVAIKLAIESNVDIILCPFSSLGYSQAISTIIDQAVNSGIKVVVSAGNDAASALDYCPANIAQAITVGALNENGDVAEFSNYGENVDAWVYADSTSMASAKIAAALSNGIDIENFKIGLDSEDDDDLEFETNKATTSDELVDGGVYIIRLRREPKRSLVQQSGGYSDGNKFVLSSGDYREDSGGQFKLQKIKYNFYIKVRDNTDYIMSPEGGASNLGTNGQKVHMWKKASSAYKDFDQWYMQKVDNGKYYRISNGQNPGMHLQTEGSATAGNTYTHLWNATSGTQGDWIFERVHYFVKFNGNGNTGGSMSNQKIWQEVSTALTSNAFTKTGYSFNGWNTNSSGTGTNYSNGQKVTCLNSTNAYTVNLYAKWKANTYAVAYNGNGATSGTMGNSSHTYDTSKTLTANTYARTGYVFAGWNTKADGTGTSYANKASVKNLATSGTFTLYAQWTPNTYYVAYNGNGSTSGSMSNSTHTYGTAKNLTANAFTKTGYSFASWNIKEDGTGTSYADKASVNNLTATDKATVTLYARWNANTYTVNYLGNGNTGGSTAASTHTYDTAKLLTANGYTKTGYKFKNWNTTAQGTGTTYADTQSVKNLTNAKDGTFNLYAQWEATAHSLALDSQNANVAGTTNVYYLFDTPTYYSDAAHQTAITAITLPEKTGYTFAGYFSEPHGEGNQYISATGAFINDPYKLTDTKLYAYWIANTYTVTFDGNGGTLAQGTVSPLTATFDTPINVHHPIREGYTFLGWNISNMEEGVSHTFGDKTNADASAQSVHVTHFNNLRASEGTVAFVASWQANTYTVRFDSNDGTLDSSTINPYIATFDDDAFTVKAPTRQGYIFHGWRVTGLEGTSAQINGETITGTSYTIETEADAEVTFKNLRSTTGEAEITALWAVNKYTIELKLNGAESINIDTEYLYNHTFSIPNPIKPGYTFIGWTITGMSQGTTHIVGGQETTATEAAGVMGTSFGKLHTQAGKVTFEARWESDDISVILTAPEADQDSDHLRRIYYTFDVDAYFEDEDHEVSLVQPIKTPTRENYTFTGYYESSDGTGDALITAEGMVNATLYNKYPAPHSLYAGWDANIYEITLSQDDTTTTGTAVIYEKYNTGIYEDDKATTALDSITKPTKIAEVTFDVDTTEISAPDTQNVELQFDGYYDGEVQLIGPAGQLMPSFTGTYFTEDSTINASFSSGNGKLPSPQEREGYTFVGWYNQQDEKVGDANASYTVEEDTTFIAHWQEDPQVVYDGNDATSGSVENGTTAKGKTYTIAANGYTKTGYTFVNWNTKANGTGNSYTEKSTVIWNEELTGDNYTLYAQWSANKFVKIQDIDDQAFTGNPITTEVVVIDNNGNVVAEEEYELEFTNNTTVGKATVTVTPKQGGNYCESDSISKEFNIVKAPYSQFKESKTNYNGVYDGVNHFVKVNATVEDEIHAYKVGYGKTAQEAETNAETATSNTGYSVKDVNDSGTIYYHIIPDNYEAYTGTLNATITPKQLTVSGLSATNKVYDGKTNVTVTGSGQLVGVVDDDDVSLDDANVTYAASEKSVGEQNVIVSGYVLQGTEISNYTLAQPDNITVTISKKPVSFVWTDESFTYDRTLKVYEGAQINTADICAGDTVNVGAYSDNAKTDAGNYEAEVTALSGADSGNYSIGENKTHAWSIAKATNTVTVTMADWTYGKTASEPEAISEFGTADFEYSSDNGVTWSADKPSNAGSYKVKATVPAGDNYEACSATVDFEIKKADITIIANDATSVRNQALVTNIGFTITGDYVEGDTISATVNTTANPTIAGKYVTEINSYDAGANYNIVETKNGVYRVTRNYSSVTATDYNGTYDGEYHGITVTVKNDDKAVVYYRYQGDDTTVDAAIDEVHSNYNVTNDDDFKPAYEALVDALEASSAWKTTNPTFKDASTTAVDYIVVTDQSKPDVIEGSKDVVINKAPLTITAIDNAITYGDAPAASEDGVAYSGLILGEVATSVLKGTLSYNYSYVQFDNVGTYAITPSGLTANNYEITFADGDLIVNPLPVVLTWAPNQTKFAYNGSTYMVIATVSNKMNSDDVSVGTYSNNVKSEIGEYTAEATALTGSKSNNYTLENGENIAYYWSIVNKTNNVSVTIADWTYGDNPSSPVVTADFNKDSAIINYFDKDENPIDNVPTLAGTYYVQAIVPSNGYYFEGKSELVEFKINKKVINILIDNKVSKYGNPLLPLTYQLSDSLVDSSHLGTIELSTTASKQSSAGDYEITAEYSENDNYDVNVVKGTYTISKAAMNTTISGYTGVYDGKQHGITIDLDPRALDKVTIYYAEEKLDESNFETKGSTTPITKKDAGETTVYYYIDSNYYNSDPISGSTVISISKKALTVKANDHEITYGDQASNDGVTYDGLIDGDNIGEVAYTYKNTETSETYAVGSNVGTYHIIPSGLNDTNYVITYENGVLTVKQLVATFTWNKTSFDYNGLEQSPVATITNKIEGDDVTVGEYSGNVKKDIGSYVAEVRQLSGTKADNYKISNTEASTNHNWKIVQVDNEWEDEPEIANWTYGKTPSEPTATPKFGSAEEVIYEYKKLNDEDRRYTTDVPTLAGKYTMRATVVRTDNYRQLSSEVNFEIEKAIITITAEDQDSPYRSTQLNELTSKVEGDYKQGDELGIVLSTDATILSPVGNYTIDVDWDNNPNYNATLVKGTYRITKAHLSIAHSNVTVAYDGEPHTIDVRITQPDLHDAVIYYSNEVLNDETFNTATKTTDPEEDFINQTEVGSKTVYFYVLSENFDAKEGESVYGSNTVTVTKRDLDINIEDQIITYGDEKDSGIPHDLSESISYEIHPGCTDDIVYSSIKFEYNYEQYGDVGTYEISIVEDSITSNNFNLKLKEGKLIVNPKPITFTWLDENGEKGFVYFYDGKPHHIIATPVTINNDVIEGELTYENNNYTDVGDYTARVTALPTTGKAKNYTILADEDSAKHNWDIDQAKNEWTNGPSIASWTYGEHPNAPEAEAKFGTGNIKYQYRSTVGTNEWSDEVPSQAGDYELRATIPATDNYELLETEVEFKINKAKIKVIADDKTSKYLEDIHEFTYTVEGVDGDKYQPNDELDVVFDCNITSRSDVGEYQIKIDVTNEKAINNYDFEEHHGTYTITRTMVHVDSQGYEGIYDGQHHGIKVEVTHDENAEEAEVFYSLSDFTKMDDIDLEEIEEDITGKAFERDLLILSNHPEVQEDKSYEISDVSDSPTKVYYLVISENYDIITGSEDIIIHKTTLNVEASDMTINYGEKPNVDDVKITYNGFVNGEDETELTGTLNIDIDYDQYDDINEEGFAITPSGLDADNYEIVYVPGKLTVNKVEITSDMVEMDENEFEYDGSEKHVNLTIKAKLSDGSEYTLIPEKDYVLEGDDSATEFGTYFVNIDGKGNFEGHIENSWRINGEKTKEEIDVEKGKIVLETDLFVDDINVSVEGLDEQLAYEVLTDEELERVKDGETAVVYVEISEVEAPGKEDSKPLNEKLDELDATPAVYLDIKVWKKVGDDAASPVHETGNREIILIIEVPEEFHNNDEKVERSFYLIRVHEGKADVLAGPTTETTLRVSTNKFSIYTIAYKDRLIDKKDDGGGAYVIPKTAVDNMSYRSLGLFSLALLALVAIVSKKNNQ